MNRGQNKNRKRAFSAPTTPERLNEWSKAFIKKRAAEWSQIDLKIKNMEQKWAQSDKMLSELREKFRAENALVARQKDLTIAKLEHQIETVKTRHRETFLKWEKDDLANRLLLGKIDQKDIEIELLKEKLESTELEPKRKVRKLHAYAFADVTREIQK